MAKRPNFVVRFLAWALRPVIAEAVRPNNADEEASYLSFRKEILGINDKVEGELHIRIEAQSPVPSEK